MLQQQVRLAAATAMPHVYFILFLFYF